MSWWIQDYDETRIFITDQWREWYIPKFRLHLAVDEPILHLYWTDTELGEGGITRTLAIDYRDVVDFYGGYLSNPSSAAQLGETLDAYIISAWTAAAGAYTDADAQNAVGINVGARLKYTAPTIYVNLDPITETAGFTLDETYDGHLVLLDNATELAVTVPAEPHNIEAGAEILFMAETDGALYFLEDTGVHIHSPGHLLGLDGHGSRASLIYNGSDEWSLTGNLTTALDANALLYINAIDPFVSLTDNEKTYINTYVVYLKANSLWSLYTSIHLIFWGAAAANKFNLKNPVDSDAAFRQTYTGSPTHGSTGIALNGTTQWIHSKVVPNSHLTPYDTHISYYSQTAASSVGYDAGVADGLNQWLLLKRDGSDLFISDKYAFGRRSSSANTDGGGSLHGIAHIDYCS